MIEIIKKYLSGILICLLVLLISWCGWLSWKINIIKADQSLTFECQEQADLYHTKDFEQNSIKITSFQKRLDYHSRTLMDILKAEEFNIKRLDAYEKCIEILNKETTALISRMNAHEKCLHILERRH